LLLVFVNVGYGLLAMGIIFGACELFIKVLQIYFCKKMLPEYAIFSTKINYKLLGGMVAYGMNSLLYTMGAMIIYKASDIIIGIYIGMPEVGQFSIAVTAVLLISQLIQTFLKAVKPAISDLHAREQHDQVKEVAFLAQKYSLLLLIPACSFFVLMGHDFLNIWVGDEIGDPKIIETMSTILTILVTGHCLRLAYHSNFITQAGRGDHKIFGVFTAATAVFFIVLAIICLKVLKLGLVSIAWANFIPVVLVSGIMLPLYFNHKMQITIKECVNNVWLPAIIGTMPAVVMLIICRYLFMPKNWGHIFMIVSAAAIVTLVGSYFLSVTEAEKKRFMKVLTK